MSRAVLYPNMMPHPSQECRRDKERVMSLRPSPDVSRMHRMSDADGTIWAFTKKAQMKAFMRCRREAKHFLSPRELLTQSLGNGTI